MGIANKRGEVIAAALQTQEGWREAAAAYRCIGGKLVKYWEGKNG